MPRKGELEDDEMWSIVRFLRHLPEKGSQGPAVFKEREEEHKEMTQSPSKKVSRNTNILINNFLTFN
jgi:hypothetical protein